MEVTGRVQWLPPALVSKQSDVLRQPGSRQQRRPLQPMQATPSSLNSSVHQAPVSLLTTPCSHTTLSNMWCDPVNVV
jgi:hypothetical protein